ncbi:uncharacterized protein LOC119398854 isoform X3 [Rhipicephalus sanguineus]|uniref:uncharacterized protein LOC119398854 isoform X3 n=1 Tax=Rhipicephalus sanguineus TaxID=34632 RepID=UPI0020C21C1F|nr:uncharacterized protein LOC119398854 isoform X3 [Rhipicephalus sanguineus]
MVDYSELTQGQRDMMEYVRQMLNSTQRLLLFAGINGAMENDRICWTSQKRADTVPGFHHYIYFWQNETKGSTKHLTEKRYADYAVGTQGGIPTVQLLAKDGASIDTDLSGNYTLFGANASCFVMAVIISKGQNARSKCLYWIQEGTTRDAHEACEDAFFYNCSSLTGNIYLMQQHRTECNFSSHKPGSSP